MHVSHNARRTVLLVPLTLALLLSACGGKKDADGKKPVVIGLVAKSQSNPVFQAAYTGARAAAQDLTQRYRVEIVIDWQTPPDEDAQKQADAIEQLARSGVQGIAVSASDANVVTPAINKAVELGATVACFDSDAPRSKRFCFYGTDDLSCGRQLMDELAKVTNGSCTFAIMAGNQSAPNLQRRVDGVLEQMKNYPGIHLLPDGVFYHSETPEQAAEAVNRAQTTNARIQAWIFVGGWPLFTKNALKWNPGDIKVVSVDALPAQLSYIESGHVQVLLGQSCYLWGYTAVELITDKILKNQSPPAERIIAPLARITRDNVKEYSLNWERWLSR